MPCQPSTSRPQVDAPATLDLLLMYAAQRYADHHGVSISDVIECALIHFMHAGTEPIVVQWCATHACVMEHNSSGTAVACPIEEGSDDVFVPDFICT